MPTPLIISYTEAAGTPQTGGKVFWVSDASGVNWNAWNIQYVPDFDGISRLYTNVTDALAQTVAGRGDYIKLAADFTTALTSTEANLAELNGVTVIQDGKNIVGQWFADRATANLPQTSSYALFTVTGKVKLIGIQGTVTTITQNQACTGTLSVFDTTSQALGTTNLAAATSIRNNVTNTIWSITGTFANSIQTNTLAAVYQAAPTLIAGGTQLRFHTSASNTGKAKWRVQYEPVSPGARIIAA